MPGHKPVYLQDTKRMQPRFDGYSFMQRLRNEMVRNMIFLYIKKPHSFYEEDLQIPEWGHYFDGCPIVLTHYLRFLSYQRLGMFADSVQSQKDLKRTTFENFDLTDDLLVRAKFNLASLYFFITY